MHWQRMVAVALLQASASAAAGTTLWSEHLEPPRREDGPAAPVQGCPRGLQLEVLDAGRWYPAKVLDGPDRLGLCLVSYDGYDESQNEWVNASRMRPRAAAAAGAAPPGSGTPPAASPSTPPGPAAGELPAGTYPCYAWNGTSMDYTYTDLRILAGRRYAVGDDGGRYTRAGDEVRFSGALSGAKGRYDARSATPQVELVFSSGAWAAMTCSRS